MPNALLSVLARLFRAGGLRCFGLLSSGARSGAHLFCLLSRIHCPALCLAHHPVVVLFLALCLRVGVTLALAM